MIHGLTLGTRRAHIVRAALESLSHQLHDLAGAFGSDGMPWQGLCIDGGMSANDWIAQDLADILGVPVDRPADVETTARGAAMLAAVGAGLFPSLAAAASGMGAARRRFTPALPDDKRDERLRRWHALLAST